MKCQNCSAILGCSCNIRIASDGTSCCTSCIQSYSMNQSNTVITGKPASNNHQGTAPEIISITYNTN